MLRETIHRRIYVARIRRVLPARHNRKGAVMMLSENSLVNCILRHGHESKQRRSFTARQTGGIHVSWWFRQLTLGTRRQRTAMLLLLTIGWRKLELGLFWQFYGVQNLMLP
jgi:hypothetical protein